VWSYCWIQIFDILVPFLHIILLIIIVKLEILIVFILFCRKIIKFRKNEKNAWKLWNWTGAYVIPRSVSSDGRVNTDLVYTGSGKIRVGCILGSGKIRAGKFRFYRFRINPTGLERPFLGCFFFVKIKNSAYLLLKIIRIQWKSIRIVIC